MLAVVATILVLAAPARPAAGSDFVNFESAHVHPIAVSDSLFTRRVRVNFNHRISMQFSHPSKLPVFRMEKPGKPSTGNQDIGIKIVKFRRAIRALVGFPVLGEWIVSPFFKQGRIEL